jgi:biopolymer transport protein ExbB
MQLNRKVNRVAMWIAAVGLMCAVPAVMAQPPAVPDGDMAAPVADANAAKPVPAPAADAATSEQDDSIMGMVLNSGPTGLAFMGVMILFSLAAVTVGLERAVNTQRSRILPTAFMAELKAVLARTDAAADDLRKLCEGVTTPVAKILQAGLLRGGRPVNEVEKSMEDAAAREMAAIRGGIKPLSVVGSVAPLVGLLGTVLGMIIAFRTASQEGLGRGELMAQGIYMALLTTAAGLTIAIPCLLLAALYNARVERYFREIDESLMDTMPCFARMEQSE